MGVVETLVKRGNLHGVAVRPSGSDGFPPRPGTSVRWAVAQPVQDMLKQAKALGWGNLGTIGDTAHRRKHGDHTPWSANKQRGVVYAKDTADPPWVEKSLLALCRKPDYDTTWIDFVNINGSQYNSAGKRLGSSGDFHLHVSVRAGHELTKVTFFRDIDRHHRKQPVGGGATTSPTAAATTTPEDFLMALSNAEQKLLLRRVEDTHRALSSKALDIGHPFQVDRKDWSAKLDAILKAVTGDDTSKIVAAIQAQGDQTRKALLAKIDEIAPQLAADAVGEVETGVSADELANILAKKLAERLAD